MSSLSRRLVFDSSDEDYQSCDSNDKRSPFSTTEHHDGNDKGTRDTLWNDFSINTSQQTSSSFSAYSIEDMIKDLMDPDAQFDVVQNEFLQFETNTISDQELAPQLIEDFRCIEDDEKLDISFTEDSATKTISNSMIAEFEMTSSKIKQVLQISDDTVPDVNDLVEYFFGPSSRTTTIFLEQLSIDYKTFLKWIGTILILQAYRLSYTLLIHDDGAINKKIINASDYQEIMNAGNWNQETHFFSIFFISKQNECVNANEWSTIWYNISHFPNRNVFNNDLNVDSFWLRLQNTFNEEMRRLIIQNNRDDFTEDLRLVLDDDKIHCDGKQCIWDTIKRVKHEKCNRFGANMHSLVSSLSNIVYSVAMERQDMTTMDCVKDCLRISFPRRNNRRTPNLHNVIIGFDRGYNGFSSLVSFVLQSGGHTFGTSKRSLNNIYTYDQTKRDWDKRIFKTKEGPRLVQRRICPIQDTNNKRVGSLTSIFYRNGWGGAILMQSTLPNHQFDEWDRVGADVSSNNEDSKAKLYKAQPCTRRMKTKRL